MKISIITICFNNEKDIRATIESVVNQTYDDIEYIIKDGGSKDGTMAIVNEYKDRISKIISCPDKGIYDAINQGIKAATGDVVGLIHAGDQLYDRYVIAKIADHFEKNDIDVSYGHSKIYNEKGKVVRVNKSPEYTKSLCRRGWFPSHQSIYVKRKVFEKYGYYDTEIGWAADYQWFILLFYVQNLRIKRLDAFIVRFAIGGTSTSNYKSRLTKRHKQMMQECWWSNGVEPPLGIVCWQILRKVKQIVMAKFENR
ncbi:MAG: glycosyltransferase family 2 protein [Prevotella sp.]